MADDRKKVSSEQLLILIEEIEKDSSLGNGRVGGSEAREQFNEKWEHLAKKLNSVDNGALKSIPKWQQAWRDWKSNTKKKAAKFAKDKGDNSQPLTPLEQRVLEMSENDSPERQNGINISNIAEVDQSSSSSSSDSEDSDEESVGSDSNPASSDTVTLYSGRGNETVANKRSHSVDENKVGVKRRRRNVTLETISRQNKRILTRLAHLEQSQYEFQKRHAELLAGILASLERQLTMEERLSSALNRIANFVDDNAGPGG